MDRRRFADSKPSEELKKKSQITFFLLSELPGNDSFRFICPGGVAQWPLNLTGAQKIRVQISSRCNGLYENLAMLS
jgi:hypothetical protein